MNIFKTNQSPLSPIPSPTGQVSKPPPSKAKQLAFKSLAKLVKPFSQSKADYLRRRAYPVPQEGLSDLRPLLSHKKSLTQYIDERPALKFSLAVLGTALVALSILWMRHTPTTPYPKFRDPDLYGCSPSPQSFKEAALIVHSSTYSSIPSLCPPDPASVQIHKPLALPSFSTNSKDLSTTLTPSHPDPQLSKTLTNFTDPQFSNYSRAIAIRNIALPPAIIPTWCKVPREFFKSTAIAKYHRPNRSIQGIEESLLKAAQPVEALWGRVGHFIVEKSENIVLSAMLLSSLAFPEITQAVGLVANAGLYGASIGVGLIASLAVDES